MIVRTLENVEDMDAASLTAGIVWEFQTYPEYLELVRRRGTVLNFTAYVGHSAVRLYVMGDAAYERAATPDEIDADVPRSCVEAIDAGAAGFSTSFAYTHRGMDGKPVPSRFAERDEVEALFLAAGSTGKGVVLATAGRAVHLRRHVRVAAAHRAAVHVPAVRARRTARHRPQLDLHEESVPRGVQVWPQVTPRPLTMQFTMESPFSLNVERGVRRAHGRRPRRAHRRVPRSRRGGPAPRPTSSDAADEAAVGDLRGLRVRARSPSSRAGGSTSSRPSAASSPLDVMCEVARRRGPRRRASASTSPTTTSTRCATSSRTSTSRSASPTRARTSGQLCDAPLATDLLGNWVRDRERACRSSSAVRKLTGEPADMFGFVGRGYVREGDWADLCVFDPETVGTGPGAARARLPGRRRAPHRRGADGRAPRARERHADPSRRACSSTLPTCAPARDRRSA